MTTLRALEDDRMFFVSIFHLSARELFNHLDVALLTNHDCLLPKMIRTNGASLLLGCFRIAFRTLIKLLLALNSTEVKGLSLIGGGCGCMLRVDFHSTDGITHGRRLAFHFIASNSVYSHFIVSAQYCMHR